MTRFRSGACIDCGSSICECEGPRIMDPIYLLSGPSPSEETRLKLKENWDEMKRILSHEERAEASRRLVDSLKNS